MEFIKGKWYRNPGNWKGADKIFAKFNYQKRSRMALY